MTARRSLLTDILIILLMLAVAALLRYCIGLLPFVLQHPWVLAFQMVPVYFLISLFIVSTLGHCPLRWRKLAFWTAVILVAHAYWIEFLLHYVFAEAPHYYWLIAFVVPASAAGISYRLRHSYKRCGCNPQAQTNSKLVLSENLQPYSGIPGVNALITHHPRLPEIISRTFNWKHMTLGVTTKWQLSLVCTGRSLVSLPHFSYGALFCDPELKDPIKSAEAFLRKLHFDDGFSGIEFRNVSLAVDTQTLKVSSWLTLKPSPDAQWWQFSSNLRRKINKAVRHGMVVEQGGAELLPLFYDVYARHIRSIGSGALTRRFFETMLAEWNDGYVGIFLVKYHGKVIGAAFNHEYKGFYENGWFATLKAWQRLYPSYLLHREMIAHAISLGCHTYSFGQSTRGSGVHGFKQQWKTWDVPLQWLQFPEPSINIRRQGWIKVIWKQLPYPVGNRIGNFIAKWVY